MKEIIETNSAGTDYGYAPVVIPTLNRFVHFKRCLESLERCTGADKTDVYVGLDYPPSEEYVEGWKLIDQFLAEKERSNGFKNLYVRRRAQNCGVSKKGSNFGLLMQEIRQKYETYISTEDDNEFSPNFLEFVNYGLLKYRDRTDVMAVCGFLFPEVDVAKDLGAFMASFSCTYGTGYWTYKKYDFHKDGLKVYVENILSSWNLSWKLYCKRSKSLNSFISMHFRKSYYGDVVKTAELLLTDKFTLFPSISKVRNWGHDGSGIHCSITDKYIKQTIDDNSIFNETKEVPKLKISDNIDFGFLKRIVIIIRYIGLRVTKLDLLGFYWRFK